MKLITLNTWAGKVHEPILEFFRRQRNEADIFCLQEVCHESAGKHDFHLSTEELLHELAEILSDHTPYFHPFNGDYYGNALFVRNTFIPKTVTDHFVFKTRDHVLEVDQKNHARSLQLASFEQSGKRFSVINVHGLWNGQGKTDTPERLEQSRRIAEIIHGIKGEAILAGDFNLEPNTESLAMLEAAGLRNLVKEYGVTSTRTSLYAKPGKFADYILVSSGIDVKDFRVLPDEVSDHAPLYLEFDV